MRVAQMYVPFARREFDADIGHPHAQRSRPYRVPKSWIRLTRINEDCSLRCQIIVRLSAIEIRSVAVCRLISHALISLE